MADRLTGMQIFMQVVESGSFAGAASRLAISPQQVGKDVAAIEQRLGTRLLNRSTRRQSLTEAGQLFLEGCRRTLAEADRTEASVVAQVEAPRGMLRVTAPVAFGTLSLVPKATAFLAAHPHVSIQFDLTDRRINLIEEGFDAAIRIGDLPDASLITRVLRPYQLIPCASPDYLAVRGMPHRPSELSAHECIDYLFPTHPAPTLWQFRSGEHLEEFKPNGQLAVNDSRAVIEAALQGFGIIVMADLLVAEHLATGRLIRVLPNFHGPSRPMHLLTSAKTAQAPKLRAFLSWASAAFGTYDGA